MYTISNYLINIKGYFMQLLCAEIAVKSANEKDF